MQQFCPACQSMFASEHRCPRCGGLLLMPQEVGGAGYRPKDVPPDDRLRPTAAGRVLSGGVVAVVLYLGLRKLALAAAHFAGPDPAAWWETASGLGLVYGLQLAAVLVGGLLAGAARPRGFATGAAVGGLCGGLFLAAEVVTGTPAGQLVLYLQPPLLALAAGLAAAVGSRVWPPAPAPLPAPQPVKGKSSARMTIGGEVSAAERERPTAWVRVLAAAALMAAGVGYADTLRTSVEKASVGLLKVQGMAQAQFIAWQLAALAVVTAAAVAGAGTGAGVRHGLYAGFLGGVGAVGVLAARGGNGTPQVTYMLEKLSMGSVPPLGPSAVMVVVAFLTLAGVCGGWLGGRLVLPLAPESMRRRKTYGGD